MNAAVVERDKSSGILCSIVSWKQTDISEVRTAFITRAMNEAVPPKQSVSTRLNDTLSGNVGFILAAVKTRNLTP